MKNIIVVADDEIKKSGRKFVHLLSKIENTKVTLYSPKIYEDNEHQITGNNHIIFLGKNKVSDDFFSVISSWKNKKGVFWGYDNKKAIVYIKDSNFSEKEVNKELKSSINSLTVAGTLGAGWAVALGGIFSPLWLVVAIMSYFNKSKQLKKIQEKQYDIGMLNFIEQDLEDFIK